MTHAKLSKEQINDRLSSRFEADHINALRDLPPASMFKDMAKATARIAKAIANSETIILVSDYDVDGVVSRVLLEEFFTLIGFAHLECITPNRFRDGYGLSKKLIENRQASVIITVDNGITSYEAGEYCEEQGIDLIITDHHIAAELPKSYAIVNPKQPNCPFPFKDICGAQVAWYLIAGLKEELDISFDMMSNIDLLCLAIIADVMPLVSMNRVLVKKALQKIKTSNRPAMIAIREKLQKTNITSQDIAFFVAPCINAAGRLKDASFAIDFLHSADEIEAADRLDVLVSINDERKEKELEIIKKCELLLDDKADVLLVASEEFNEGVIGIAASKIASEQKKVCFVGSIQEHTQMVKCSARSYGDVDLYGLIDKNKSLVHSFGGHRQAAGLNIEKKNWEEFKQKINEVFKSEFAYEEANNVFCLLDKECVDFSFVEMLDAYEPYGHGNEMPVFLIENIEVAYAQVIGANKNVLKIVTPTSNGMLQGVKFRHNDDGKVFDEGEEIDIIATVNKNIFRGNESVQFIIQEIRQKTNENQTKLRSNYDI